MIVGKKELIAAMVTTHGIVPLKDLVVLDSDCGRSIDGPIGTSHSDLMNLAMIDKHADHLFT